MSYLFYAAIIPVIALGYYIYKKDTHSEPLELLAKIFGMGCLTVIPVAILELILGSFFPTEGIKNALLLFVNTFVSVALVEEGFKWIVTKKYGYNSNSFDEIYDIIVYSVFASLGFACIENILYVFTGGLSVAFTRALLSIPGHTCFGVLMGFFLAKAKINYNSGNNKLYNRNILLSLFIPMIGHTLYDFFLFLSSAFEKDSILIIFFIFYIVLVIICFRIVKRLSTVQQNITTNVNDGTIIVPKQGNVVINPTNSVCPICGRNIGDYNYCPYCGVRLKK